MEQLSSQLSKTMTSASGAFDKRPFLRQPVIVQGWVQSKSEMLAALLRAELSGRDPGIRVQTTRQQVEDAGLVRSEQAQFPRPRLDDFVYALYTTT